MHSQSINRTAIDLLSIPFGHSHKSNHQLAMMMPVEQDETAEKMKRVSCRLYGKLGSFTAHRTEVVHVHNKYFCNILRLFVRFDENLTLDKQIQRKIFMG